MEVFLELFGEALGAILAAIVAAIVAFFNRKKIASRFAPIDYSERKQKRKRSYTRSPIIDEQIIMRIKEEDPEFNAEAFKEAIKETFLEFQKAWSNGDMTVIRGKLDHNLCEQYQLMLQENKQRGVQNKAEVIQVNYVDFSSYAEDNEKETLEAAINVVMYDYEIEEATDKIINGSKTVKSRTTYKLLFMRKDGTQTGEERGILTCPNCGALLTIEQKKCDYCKALILNNAKEWVLNNIERY